MAEIKFGEYTPDQQSRGGQSSLILNAYPQQRGYSSFNSIVPVSPPLDSKPLGAIMARNNNGHVRSFAGTQTKLYEVNVVSADVSKPGDYLVIDGHNWEFVHWQVGVQDRIIALTYNAPIQYTELDAANLFADLPGSPPRAKHMAIVRDFLVLGNTFDEDGEKGNRLRWSAYRDLEEWIPGTNQSDFQDLAGNGGRIQAIFGGEYGIIFQESSIWRMEYVGTPIVFQLDEIEPGKGLFMPKAAAQFGSSIFFLGRDGFYQLVDGHQAVPIGAEKVDRTFFKDFDANFRDSLSCAIDPLRNLVIWTYAGAGSFNGVANKSLIYNWNTKKWAMAEFGVSLLYFGATLSYTLDELDPFGDMETLPFSLDSDVWKAGNQFLAGFTTDFEFGFFDGPPLVAVLETAEIGGEGRTHISTVRPFVESTTNPVIEVAIVKRDAMTAGLNVGPYRALDNTGKANFRSDDRYQRIRVRIADGFSHANSVDAGILDRGKR